MANGIGIAEKRRTFNRNGEDEEEKDDYSDGLGSEIDQAPHIGLEHLNQNRPDQ